MKNFAHWENIVLLLSAIALLPIWLSKSKEVPLPNGLPDVLHILQFIVLVVLVSILIRRLRRVLIAFKENKNRQGRFPF